MDKNYDVINFTFKKGLEWSILLTSKSQRFLLEQPLKTQKKLREIEIMHYNAIFICIS